MRFFVFESTWDPVGQAYRPAVRRKVPPYVCLGAQAAALVDPRIATVAAVRTQWRTFGLPAAVVVTQPQGQTLAGAVTRLSTSAPLVATLPPKTVLGLSVTLTVTAVSYTWDFGDGTGSTTTGSGAGQQTEHVYRRLGGVQVGLRTSYTATFTIAGSPVVYPLDGTANVLGPPTALLVREARTQLEAGP